VITWWCGLLLLLLLLLLLFLLLLLLLLLLQELRGRREITFYIRAAFVRLTDLGN